MCAKFMYVRHLISKKMATDNVVVLEDESPSLLQGESLELLRLEGATSRMWDYFGFPAQKLKFLQLDKKK